MRKLSEFTIYPGRDKMSEASAISGVKWRGFEFFFGNSILPNDQKLIHIINKQALNFFYSRLISSAAGCHHWNEKVENLFKIGSFVLFPLEKNAWKWILPG